uniref:Uncharacterized protein n=1 Tax=Parascaris univalens TaxID=6257 RepID=A0A915CHN2_PARUN
NIVDPLHFFQRNESFHNCFLHCAYCAGANHQRGCSISTTSKLSSEEILWWNGRMGWWIWLWLSTWIWWYVGWWIPTWMGRWIRWRMEPLWTLTARLPWQNLRIELHEITSWRIVFIVSAFLAHDVFSNIFVVNILSSERKFLLTNSFLPQKEL